MSTALCPNCESRVKINAKPRLGQIYICDSCDMELALTRLNPPALDWPEFFDDEFEEALYDDEDYLETYEEYGD